MEKYFQECYKTQQAWVNLHVEWDLAAGSYKKIIREKYSLYFALTHSKGLRQLLSQKRWLQQVTCSKAVQVLSVFTATTSETMELLCN